MLSFLLAASAVTQGWVCFILAFLGLWTHLQQGQFLVWAVHAPQFWWCRSGVMGLPVLTPQWWCFRPFAVFSRGREIHAHTAWVSSFAHPRAPLSQLPLVIALGWWVAFWWCDVGGHFNVLCFVQQALFDVLSFAATSCDSTKGKWSALKAIFLSPAPMRLMSQTKFSSFVPLWHVHISCSLKLGSFLQQELS